MKRLEESTIFLHEVDDILLWHAFAIDTYALTEIDEVRGSVETNFVALALKNGSDGVGTRAFSIGTGDVDSLILKMWMTEMLVESECSL